ncbi:MAG: hypothetical protein GX119_02045 [Syntrophomonadaceae bacterium]|jgi:hypothetical protein|nr:hypothetical protein [Syntrophomonadaceae bacterium]
MNIWRVLGGITFAVLFFWTPLLNLSLWGLLLILACISSLSLHLAEQRKHTGKWVMNWDIFLQHLLLGGVVLSCFTLYILRELSSLPIIMAGVLLLVAVYATILGLKKEDDRGRQTVKELE